MTSWVRQKGEKKMALKKKVAATKKKPLPKQDDLRKLEGVKVTTPPMVGSYPKLFKPVAYKGKGEKYYSCVFIAGKKVDLTDMRKAVTRAKREAFGPDKEKWPKCESFWRDGNEKSDATGYEDSTYFTAKSKSKPLVIDKDRQPIEEESEIYGGVIVRAVIQIKITEVGGKYFITPYLQGVMKWKDGAALGGGASAEDFEIDESELEDADDEDESDDEETEDEDEESDDDDSDDDDE